MIPKSASWMPRKDLWMKRLLLSLVVATPLVGPAVPTSFGEEREAARVQPARLSSIAKKIAARLKKRGFSILPDALTALQSRTKSSAATSAATIEEYFFSAAVSGTPPTLSSFDRQGGTAISSFWRPGVVQSIAVGSPSSEQCGEFFTGPVDGQSGGLGACLMAEGVGRSFETAIDAGRSACQMRNFSSKISINDPAISFERGKKLVPDGKLKNLFNPGERERLIKVRALGEIGEDQNGNPVPLGAQNIFIRIPSNRSNERRNALYRAELHFCEDGDTSARGYNLIQVSNNGILKIVNKDTQSESSRVSTVTMTGRVTPAGAALQWVLTSPRSGEVRFSGPVGGQTLKERIGFSVSKDEVISRRLREGSQGRFAKEYSVASILGDNAVSLQLLTGAFKSESSGQGSVVGAAEFRDSFYASAPQSPLLSRAQSFDFSKDPLFSGSTDVSIDLSMYKCSLRPDISIVFEQSKVEDDFLAACESRGLKRMNFCSGSSLVQVAQERRPSVCAPPP